MFLVDEPERGVSGASRFRVYQLVPWLERQGIRCDIRVSRPPKYLLARDAYARHLRGRPSLTTAAQLVVAATIAGFRVLDVWGARDYDVIVLQRDLLPFRTVSPFIERWLARRNSRVVFDIDDAIYTWPGRRDDGTRRSGWLRDPDKVGHILSACRHVMAGNAWLAEYVRRWNPRVSVVPTTVDTEVFRPRPAEQESPTVTIGWTGSSGNLPYLEAISPALQAVARQTPVRLLVVCNKYSGPLNLGGVPVEFVEWTPEAELDALHRMDIGVMPLPDDEWSRGKCGLKALEYMACEVPAIVSPVGVNADIVADGVSGLHASTLEEWTDALIRLATSSALRRQLGVEGRRVVEQRYSAERWAAEIAGLLRRVAAGQDEPARGVPVVPHAG